MVDSGMLAAMIVAAGPFEIDDDPARVDRDAGRDGDGAACATMSGGRRWRRDGGGAAAARRGRAARQRLPTAPALWWPHPRHDAGAATATRVPSVEEALGGRQDDAAARQVDGGDDGVHERHQGVGGAAADEHEQLAAGTVHDVADRADHGAVLQLGP